MKYQYDFHQLAKMPYHINKNDRPVLPFNMRLWMFENLCEKTPSTLSDMYDKKILLTELYDAMCCDAIRNYCLCEYNDPFQEVQKMAEEKKSFPWIKFIKAVVEFVVILIKMFQIDKEDDEK